jgi:hypothetical protein
MTERELRRAAAAAGQREQDRRVQYLRDHHRRRAQHIQAERAERIATLRCALHATFGVELEHALGGSYVVVGDEVLMEAVYEVPVGDVVLRIRQVRDDVDEQWMCAAVAGGTPVPVHVVPDWVAVNRDRLLLALDAVYRGAEGSARLRQRSVGGHA